ncbi:MAG: hypothetical protein LBO68_01200, partial [Synergistaceae bacterium]|nr:hypothetical protein [Synergistaceae bacterium]
MKKVWDLAEDPNARNSDPRKGTVVGVFGSVAVAEADFSVRLFEVVRLGEGGLLGEVLEVRRSSGGGLRVDIQAWEDLTGLSVGEEVLFTKEFLSAELGPGLLDEVLDGLGRPLRAGAEREIHLERGVLRTQKSKLWRFRPSVKEGEKVFPGDVLGTVMEGGFLHRILVSPDALSSEAR